MTARDRRPRFRAAVYAPREEMTNGCRVLLLRLADSMDVKGIVSVPRAALATELGVHTSRVTENIALARRLGLLDVVRRGRPGVTAVYQALVPASAHGAPQRTTNMVRSPGGDMVRPSAPLQTSTWCARAVTQVVDAERPATSTPSVQQHDEGAVTRKHRTKPVASRPTACDEHGFVEACPPECSNHPHARGRTA